MCWKSDACPFIRLILIILLTITVSHAEIIFPDWQSESGFHKDIRTASLTENLPNSGEHDYYLGLSQTWVIFHSNQNKTMAVPGGRMSIYPNPEYNLWAQFAQWPGDKPAFSVGTGVQVEFQSSRKVIRKAIGLSWNEVYGSDYIQRDIKVHALFGRSVRSFDYGLIGILDLQRVIIGSGNRFPDYDATILQAVPYIGWIFAEQSRITFMVPGDIQGVAARLQYEWQLGKRK